MSTKLSREHLLPARVLGYFLSHLASRLKTCRLRASLVGHTTARKVSNPWQHPWAPLLRARRQSAARRRAAPKSPRLLETALRLYFDPLTTFTPVNLQNFDECGKFMSASTAMSLRHRSGERNTVFCSRAHTPSSCSFRLPLNIVPYVHVGVFIWSAQAL